MQIEENDTEDLPDDTTEMVKETRGRSLTVELAKVTSWSYDVLDRPEPAMSWEILVSTSIDTVKLDSFSNYNDAVKEYSQQVWKRFNTSEG